MRMGLLSGLGLLAAVSVLPSALRIATDVPRFTPKAGVILTRTLEMKGVRELRSMVIKVGDKEQQIEDVDVSNDLTMKCVIVDEYLAVAAGDAEKPRVEKLERTFETLTKSNTEKRRAPSNKEESQVVPETCALEGETVVFTWSAAKDAYVPKFKAGDHDAKLLAKLNLDMDYTLLLPPPGTAEGDTWKLDLEDVKTALLRPTGYLPFKTERKVPPMELRLRDAAWEGTSGRLELRWKARSRGKTSPDGKTHPEDDGLNLAVIEFEGTLAVDASVDREDEKNAPDRLGTRSSEKIHGELVWDVARGGPHSIEWTSTGTVKVHITAKQSTQDEKPIEMEQILSFDQEYTFKGSFEAK